MPSPHTVGALCSEDCCDELPVCEDCDDADGGVGEGVEDVPLLADDCALDCPVDTEDSCEATDDEEGGGMRQHTCAPWAADCPHCDPGPLVEATTIPPFIVHAFVGVQKSPCWHPLLFVGHVHETHLVSQRPPTPAVPV